MKQTLITILITAFLFGIYTYGVYEIGKKSVKIEPEIHVVDNYISVKDSFGYKPQIIKVKEKVNIDSIFAVAKKFWQKTDTVYKDQPINYVARLDTTYQDSLLTAMIGLYSRIPIDPEAYYNLKFKVKQRTIYNTKNIPVYPSSRYFAQIGVRMNLTDKVEPIYEAGAGVYIIDNSFIEMPLSLNAEYIEKLNWNIQTQIRIKPWKK